MQSGTTLEQVIQMRKSGASCADMPNANPGVALLFYQILHLLYQTGCFCRQNYFHSINFGALINVADVFYPDSIPNIFVQLYCSSFFVVLFFLCQ